MFELRVKKDDEKYQGFIRLQYPIGEVGLKSKNKMTIQTHANVKTMQQVYKERLQDIAGLMDFDKNKEREKFDEALKEYVYYNIIENLCIKELPLRLITDDDNNVVDVEGLEDELQYEVIVEKDDENA